MRKFIVMLAMLTMAIGANAQFEKGRKTVEAALTGLGMSYNGATKFNFGVQAKAGYFIENQWQLNALVGFRHYNVNHNQFIVGVGGRYYIIENGLYGGVNAKGVFENGHNDFMPGVEIGYTFFVNDKVAIEPAIYYDQSLSDHKNYSTVGLKIGAALYF
jgi:hypothetical protein